MEHIRRIAIACVGRAVFFGTIAISVVMFSFSFNPVTALHSGALMTLIMSAILVWKAHSASWKNPARTEVWLYLRESERPRQEHARIIFGSVLREIYARFAAMTFCAALTFFAMSWVLMGLGFRSLGQMAQLP